MAYNIIAKLSDPSIESKVELIKYLIKRAADKKSNEEFEDSISAYLSEKEKIRYLHHYCLIGPKYALGCFVGHFLYHYISEKDLKKQTNLLTSLLEFIKGFQPSSNVLLKKTTTVKLIETLEQFGLPQYFLRASDNRPLRIYYIPFKHKDVNAAYYPHLNFIASYKPKEEEDDPAYIFVHEVGHLLTFNLTGDAGKVPGSFIEFNKKFNPKWKGDLVEVFVDLFSMAVMKDTEHASKNPFLTKFLIRSQEIIRNYFITLMGNISHRNPNRFAGNDFFEPLE